MPIEDIKPGCLIWVPDEHVIVDSERITCTPNHSFYSPVKGWTDAIQLKAGDRLQLLNGEYVIIEQVQHELLESPVTVYNFEVKGFHTYFVGETSVLVHNSCGDKYYKATRTDGGVQQGMEITKKEALNRVRHGNDVIANSRSAAKKLAKDAFGNSRVYSEIHKSISNAMYHFHDASNHFFHIFFR